ncbi:MAG: hypothetical protein ACI8QD_001676 [Cyclobacteriaceae bacterium]|jgi:uncharacterized protein YbjT (DUF2867 family)
MKAVILGSSGMIGQAVLIECLENTGIEHVLLINRRPERRQDPKLTEILHEDFLDFTDLADTLTGYDICFYCVGITSAGLNEAHYTVITHKYTIRFAQAFLRANQQPTFIFISGAGTDSSEKNGTMWARVKGKTENDLLGMDFENAYMFRPGMIIPKKGVVSRTTSYRIGYLIMKPLSTFMRRFPKYVTDSVTLAQAMISVATNGYKKKILESEDINKVKAV